MQPSGASTPRAQKRTKAGVLVSEITYEDLAACFTMPTEKACVKLGVGVTILKRLARKFGIARWPYRTLLKAGKTQRVAPEVCSPAVTPRLAMMACSTPMSIEKVPVQSSSSCRSSQATAASEGSNRPSATTEHWAPFAAVPAAATAAAPARAVATCLPQLGSVSTLTAAATMQQQAAAAAATVAGEVVGCSQERQLSNSASHMNVLLSAIDACEAVPSSGKGAAAQQPPSPVEQSPWAPITPHFTLPTTAASTFACRPFSHSTQSVFKPVPRKAAPPALTSEGVKELLALLQQHKQQRRELRERQQEQKGLFAGLAASGEQSTVVTPRVPTPPGISGFRASALLDMLANTPRAAATGDSHGTGAGAAGDATTLVAELTSDERMRIRLAEKLLRVRAALQARIARKQAALALAASSAGSGSSRFSPYPCSPLTPTMASADIVSGPVPITSVPPTDLLTGMSSQEAEAFANARNLLGKYRL